MGNSLYNPDIDQHQLQRFLQVLRAKMETLNFGHQVMDNEANQVADKLGVPKLEPSTADMSARETLMKTIHLVQRYVLSFETVAEHLPELTERDLIMSWQELQNQIYSSKQYGSTDFSDYLLFLQKAVEKRLNELQYKFERKDDEVYITYSGEDPSIVASLGERV